MNNLFEPIAATTPRATSPYVNPEYEASPLSRPLKQINEDLSETTMAYGTNTIEDAVKLFTVNAANTLQACWRRESDCAKKKMRKMLFSTGAGS